MARMMFGRGVGLTVSGSCWRGAGRGSGARAGHSVMIWIQVRDVHAEHAQLAAAGVPIAKEPVPEPWGLTEMWIEDPDGTRIVLVEVPASHPLRRDSRSTLPPVDDTRIFWAEI